MKFAVKQPLITEQESPHTTPSDSGLRKHPHETVRRFLPAFFALLTVIVCMAVLYAGDNVGLSNNGDFRRVLLSNHMTFADDTDSRYLFKDRYIMEISGDTVLQRLSSLVATSQEQVEYTSPHFLFVKASKLLNYFSNRITGQAPETYSLWYLALLYSLALSAAAYFLISFFQKLSSRVTAGVLFLLVFCDAGYILYFNSFYGEAVQYVTVLLLAGVLLHLLRKPKTYGLLAVYFVTLYLFAGSKLANIPYAIAAALFCLLFFLLEKDRRFRIVLSGGVCVTVAALVILYTSIPAWMDYDTTYQSVFFGILKSSQTPVQDLEELGLNPELAVLQNTHAYMSDYLIDIHTEAFTSQFYDKTGKVDIALFYLRHPVRLTEKLSVAVQNSASIRPPYLGSSAHIRMGQTGRFSLWSHVRLSTRLLYTPLFILPFLLLLSIAALTVLIIQIYKRRTCNRRAMLASAMFLLLLGGIWIALAIPIIGNGEADLSKHMFLFIHLLDILVMALVAALMMHIRQIAAAFVRHLSHLGVICILLILVTTGVKLYWTAKTNPQTFTLGAYDQKPIVWEIIGKNPDGSVRAVSQQVLTVRAFDTTGPYGSNLWSESALRRWLNGAFLENFTAEEQARLQPMDNRVLLAAPYAADSESGDHPHFWTGVPNMAAFLEETAYAQTVTDKVSLLTLGDYQRGGFRRAVGKSYWLADPYTDNGEMVRYADPYGFAIYCDANRTLGIRPVITVK